VGQGLSFSKPSEYLAIAFYESGRPKAQILNEIPKLVICKCPNLILHQRIMIANCALQIVKKAMVAYLTKKVLEDPTVQRHNNKFFRTFSSLGKRFRLLSPSKGKKKVMEEGQLHSRG